MASGKMSLASPNGHDPTHGTHMGRGYTDGFSAFVEQVGKHIDDIVMAADGNKG